MPSRYVSLSSLFFFNDTATTEIYTLSLHDALPISEFPDIRTDQFHIDILTAHFVRNPDWFDVVVGSNLFGDILRSEEHTSELQSPDHLVCRLLLEKKNRKYTLLASRITSRSSSSRT